MERFRAEVCFRRSKSKTQVYYCYISGPALRWSFFREVENRFMLVGRWRERHVVLAWIEDGADIGVGARVCGLRLERVLKLAHLNLSAQLCEGYAVTDRSALS